MSGQIKHKKVFEQIWYWSDKYPCHSALVNRDQVISYGELEQRATALALKLLSMGIESGDRVAYLLNVCPEFYYTYLAASMIGAIAVGIGVRSTPVEIRRILEETEPKAVVCEPELCELLRPIAGEGCAVLPSDELELDGSQSRALLGKLELMKDRVGEDTPLFVIYTSGTTGKPKGSVLTHKNVLTSALAQNRDFRQPGGCTMDDVFLNYVPVNHVSGAVEWGVSPMTAGMTLVLLPVFNPSQVLETTVKYRATILAGVPAMWTKMLSLPDFSKYDLSSVRWCLSGAAPLSRELAKRIYDICPVCSNPLGMTETSGFCSYFPYGSGLGNLSETIGKIIPELEYKIVGKDGGSLKWGETGHLIVRGDSVIKSYYTEIAATDGEGFLSTGDMAFEDAEGLIHLCGRKDDMFTVGGYNVYPTEVENVIMEYPGVESVVVMPIPHRTMGSVCRAYIVPKTGAHISADKLEEYVSKILIYYKVPRNYVLLERMPSNALGKTTRNVFAKEIREEFK